MSSDVALVAPLADREAVAASQMAGNQRTLGRFASFAIWTLPLVTFTAPGRDSPSSLAVLDGLATFKLIILSVVLCGGIPLIRSITQDATTRRTLVPLVPYLLYLGWAVASVLWTPLPQVTIGQTGGLTSLLLLTTFVALNGQERVALERVLKTLCKSLLFFSLLVLLIHLWAPNFSGLDRRMLIGGSSGVVHPTAASANASLGLLVITLCRCVGGYVWSVRFMGASLLIHGLILYYASSRAALGMAILTVPLVAFLYAGNWTRALAMSILSGLAIGLMLFDPSFGPMRESADTSVQYLSRGQSVDQLRSVSGRTEMWRKVWDEYKKSKLIGHGYFMTSEAGAIRVWSMTANHTAHNIYLQVLVSTGAIGLLLFLAAIIRLCTAFLDLRGGPGQANHVYQLLLFIFLWYFGWSLFCSSFMGPIRSESVVFFTFLGIGLGQRARLKALDAGDRVLE